MASASPTPPMPQSAFSTDPVRRQPAVHFWCRDCHACRGLFEFDSPRYQQSFNRARASDGAERSQPPAYFRKTTSGVKRNQRSRLSPHLGALSEFSTLLKLPLLQNVLHGYTTLNHAKAVRLLNDETDETRRRGQAESQKRL